MLKHGPPGGDDQKVSEYEVTGELTTPRTPTPTNMMHPLVLTRPATIRSLIEQLGHRPGRSMGQNYLVDANILAILMEAVGVEPGMPVLEIGPGLGVLTQALVQSGAEVTAVEKDATLAEHIRRTLPGVRLLEEDATRVDWNEWFARGIGTVAANLPYSVGSRIIVQLIEAEPSPQRMVFMVQKEVADRLCAQPGGKTYGPLAIWSQRGYDVHRIKIVRPSCFMPKPKVDSAIVRFERRARSLAEPSDYSRFKWLVKQCFTRRRKQIGTILRALGAGAEQELERIGIDPALRPEQIGIEQWVALSEQIDPDLSASPR